MLFRHIPIAGRLFILALLVLTGRGVIQAQESVAAQHSSDDDGSIINKAEEDIRLWERRRDPDFALRADRRLKDLLRRNPESPFRGQIEERLATLGEPLAQHSLVVALYYLRRFEERKTSSAPGAESRLRHIVCEYPRFSRMAEVLAHLQRLYSLTGKPEAEGYLKKFINLPPSQRNYKQACEEIRQLQ